MQKCKHICIITCGIGLSIVSLMGVIGCGSKDDPPPNSPGYYTGDMKSKSNKPTGLNANTSPQGEAPK